MLISSSSTMASKQSKQAKRQRKEKKSTSYCAWKVLPSGPLPDCLTSEIFQFADLQTFSALSQACQALRAIGRRPASKCSHLVIHSWKNQTKPPKHFWDHLTLNTRSIDLNVKWTLHSRMPSSLSMPKLESMTFAGSIFSNSLAQRLYEISGQNLRSLSLIDDYVPEAYPTLLPKLPPTLRPFPKLTSLEVGGLIGLPKSLATLFPKLKKFVMRSNLADQLPTLPDSVTSVVLTRCSGDRNNGIDDLPRNLQKLHFEHVSSFDPQDFAVLSHLAQLKQLVLVGGRFDDTCVDFLRNLKELKVVEIRCGHLSFDGLETLGCLGQLTALTGDLTVIPGAKGWPVWYSPQYWSSLHMQLSQGHSTFACVIPGLGHNDSHNKSVVKVTLDQLCDSMKEKKMVYDYQIHIVWDEYHVVFRKRCEDQLETRCEFADRCGWMSNSVCCVVPLTHGWM